MDSIEAEMGALLEPYTLSPLLLISGQSKLRAIMPEIACSYDFFQQCVALPEDVDPETLESKMQDGLMVFTFGQKASCCAR